MSELRQRQPREKSKKYLDYIRSLPCTVCGDNTTTEAAHLRTSKIEVGKDDHGWGRPDDKWALPLCGQHHRQQHTMNELAFWKMYSINPYVTAIQLRAR